MSDRDKLIVRLEEAGAEARVSGCMQPAQGSFRGMIFSWSEAMMQAAAELAAKDQEIASLREQLRHADSILNRFSG